MRSVFSKRIPGFAAVLAWVLLGALLLTGCRAGGEGNGDATSAAGQTSAYVPETAPVLTEPLTEKITERPAESETEPATLPDTEPDPVPPEDPLPRVAGKTLESGAVLSDIVLPENCFDVLAVDGYLVCASLEGNGSVYLSVFQLSDAREVMKYRTGSTGAGYAELVGCGGSAYAFGSSDGLYLKFDSPLALSPSERRQVPLTRYFDYCDPTFYPDGLTFAVGEDAAAVFDGETLLSKIDFSETNYSYPQMLYRSGSKVILSVYAEAAAARARMEYYLTDGHWRVTETMTDNMVIQYGNKVVTGDPEGLGFVFADVDSPFTETRVYPLTGDEYVEGAGDDFFMTSDPGPNGRLNVYDYSGRLYYSASPLPQADRYISGCVFDDAGCYVLYQQYDDSYNIISQQLVFIETSGREPVRRRDVREENDLLEMEMEQRYGTVSLKTGYDALIGFPDFKGEPATDPYLIHVALTEIDGVLGEFPTGFFEELFSADSPCDRLILCLTGDLSPTVQGATSDPIAYAYIDADTRTQVIAVNVERRYSIRTNIAHELMHAMYSYIVTREDGGAGFMNWGDYIPSWNAYNNSYVDVRGQDFSDTKYTLSDTGNEYFIDSYSRTYNTEDMARLFENMVCHSEAGYLRAYPKIMARMTYLAEVIRSHFRTVRESKTPVVWEKLMTEEPLG